jgi:hypothetical protein
MSTEHNPGGRRPLRGTLAVALGTAALLAACVPARAEDDAGRTLVKTMIDAVPKKPFTAKAKLSSPGYVRQLTVFHKTTGDGEATFMEVTAPNDVAGTRFLFLERTEGPDRQFVYVPAVRRAVEVMEGARKQPFLGSDFYVSDLVAPDLDAFTYRITGEETVGGRACKLIEVVPKNPEAEVYGRRVVAVDPTDNVLMRSEFFDHDGKPFKVWTLDKLEKVDGIWTPRRQEMKNLQKNSTSVLEITEIAFGADVPDHVFGRQNLTR